MQSASCRCRSAPGSTWSCRPRSPATPASAAESAPRRRRGTIPPPPGEITAKRLRAAHDYCMFEGMGDSGEGLVDADARIQERIEERESERRRRGAAQPAANPDKVRELESLRLAKAELERQAAATAHPVRKQQIQAAIAEIDKRLASGAK